MMEAADKPKPGSLLRAARRRAAMSQRALADAAGTSAPTIAMYESGQKEPRISTLDRLIAAAGGSLLLVVTRADPTEAEGLSREQRRSLALNRAIVAKLLENPVDVVGRARANLDRMRKLNDASAERWFATWEHLLDGPIELIVSVLQNPTQRAASLRQVSPFSGVLTPSERWEIYRSFRDHEARRAS